MKLTVKEKLMLSLASEKLKQAEHLTNEAEQLMTKAMERQFEEMHKKWKVEQSSGEPEPNTTTQTENR